MDCQRTRAAKSSSLRHERMGSTAILGGCRALPSHARRVDCSRVDGQRRFQAQVVNPTIPEIIFVNKSLESAKLQIAESHAPGIDADQAAALPIHCVLAASDLKAVQVLVAPPEGDLQCFVKLRHRAIVAHQESPPDHRADAANHCAQLIDLCRTIGFCHAPRLRLCAAHPQLSVALYG